MKQKDKPHTTNYYDTFIEVAEDCSVVSGKNPVTNNDKKTIAERQYQIIANNPYKFTSEVLFQVFADRNDLTQSEYESARKEFFSKGQPCFRASPLTKTHGFGIHYNSEGKMACYGIDTEEYQAFLKDPKIKKVKAMRTSKK